MNDYKRAQDEDHEQLLQILTGLKEGEDNVMRAITETKEQVTLVLGLLQTVRFFPFVRPVRIILILVGTQIYTRIYCQIIAVPRP
jgi:hypothetical protein